MEKNKPIHYFDGSIKRSHVVYDGRVLDDWICFPISINMIKGFILDAILTGRTPIIDPYLNIHLNRDLQC